MRVAFCLLTILLVLSASGSMVKGTITDSATGLPITDVKVILAQLQGEREEVIDTSVTGITGGYSFTFSEPTGSGFYIRTLANQHYFHSTHIGQIEINDTITKDIKLKRIATNVSETIRRKTAQNLTIRTGKSRLYLPGIKTGAVIDIYKMNGYLLFRTVLSSGESEIYLPEGIMTAGSNLVKIRSNGNMFRGMIVTGF